MKRGLLTRGSLSVGVALVGLLLWQALYAGPATTAALGGAERYLFFVSTDKPIYKLGEDVYVRALLLEAFSLKPLATGAVLQGQVEIRGPKGDIVASGYAAGAEGALGFKWTIGQELAGGEYVLKVTGPYLGVPPAERRFDIRAYRPPRLKSQIVFLRDGYGPGDEVTATLHTERAEGGFPAGARVTVSARVDEADVYTGSAEVDAAGNCTGRFRLPASIERGEGTLAFRIEDGGVVETATKTIPILLQTLDLALYPEGGELIAGLRTRVYFEARTPAKKPADIAGVVVDETGREVARFKSHHEGRGRFSLTPKKGVRYALRVTEPAGISRSFELPSVRNAGAVVRARDLVTPAGAAVRLEVGATFAGKLIVTLAKRERVVAKQTVKLTPGALQDVTLQPEGPAAGVLIATVWDEDGKPVAERLAYRQPSDTVQLTVEPSKARYVPGEAVELVLKTRDGKNRPVSALVGLAVSDDSVHELLETRDQPPRLPVMVFLEPEVRELADAEVYLDPENPKAPRALDLLLGTQGWRRFAFLSTEAFLREHGDRARRVLALRLATAVEVETASAVRRSGFMARPQGAALAVPKAALDDMGGAPPPMPMAPPVMAPPPAAAAPPAEPAAVAIPPAPDRAAEPIIAAGEQEAPFERALRERGRADLDDALLRDAPARPVPSAFVAVREYAHAVRPNRQPADRSDFTETLYWNPGLRTDAKGEARVRFALSDAVTAFRVLGDAVGADGAIGAAKLAIESVEPFYAEAKLPLEVTAGDRIALPIALVNGAAEVLKAASVSVTAPAPLRVGPFGPAVDLTVGARLRRIVDVQVGFVREPVQIEIQAQAGPFRDKVTRPLQVVPRGFPVEVADGGLLKPDGDVTIEVTIPPSVVAQSLTSRIAVYPSPLANLSEALERLIQEPYGCFEQTSSTTYPLVMAQQYFQSHAGVDPKLIERSSGLLAKGYDRLKGFECKGHGYEWFGEDPGHEALTAFGLLEFTDMAAVRQVDAGMLARTRAWLMKTRDGKGGFKRERRALHTWEGDPDASNGYILWALLETGEKPENLTQEIAALRTALKASRNSYAWALAANVMALAKEKTAAAEFMKRLADKQTKDGYVDGATVSIVGSGGEALLIETTALATLAWMREPAFAGSVEPAMRWLAESCKGGRYGSTQSTVLALRAIVAYDRARQQALKPGRVRVFVDGQGVGDAVAFDGNSKGAIELPDVGELLAPGSHKVQLRTEGGAAIPYALRVTYHAERPNSAKECALELAVKLSATEVNEGMLSEAQVTVTNRRAEAVPMPLAIVGLPGGFEPRHDQLKELVKAGQIAAYEVRGREVILYWRSFAANEKRDVRLSLVAAVPGNYTGPASRAYLYYTDEFKTWTDGLTAAIAPLTK